MGYHKREFNQRIEELGKRDPNNKLYQNYLKHKKKLESIKPGDTIPIENSYKLKEAVEEAMKRVVPGGFGQG